MKNNLSFELIDPMVLIMSLKFIFPDKYFEEKNLFGIIYSPYMMSSVSLVSEI